jgi:hypothetical protein
LPSLALVAEPHAQASRATTAIADFDDFDSRRTR